MTGRDENARFFDNWLQATALDPEKIRGRRLSAFPPPAAYKEYPEAERFALDDPTPPPPGGLWQALAGRRSRRTMATTSLTTRELGLLLWACQGVTAQQGPYLLRTAPSAGALYPFETYVVAQRVAGLQPCLAHLNVPGFHLEILAEGSFGPYLARAALGQQFIASAAVVLVWTAILPRCAWKYGGRAVRYLGLDLGHVCQNLALAAEAMGLHCCPVAAFIDKDVNEILEVDGRREFAYYLAAVGHPPR